MSKSGIPAEEVARNEVGTPVGRLAQMVLWVAPNPEEVVLHIAEGLHNTLVEIDVKAADRGRLIGREGSVIRSLRTLLKASLSKDDPDFDIKIPDGGRRQRYNKNIKESKNLEPTGWKE